jgi:hypothetical protein
LTQGRYDDAAQVIRPFEIIELIYYAGLTHGQTKEHTLDLKSTDDPPAKVDARFKVNADTEGFKLPALGQSIIGGGTTVFPPGHSEARVLTGSVLGVVKDEALKSLMMSWYWAGYYTGLYEGQQKQTPSS